MPYLFDLPVEGESSDIEAFWSYLARLAEVHAVSVNRLLIEAFKWYITDHPGTTYKPRRYQCYGGLSNIGRPVHITQEAVDVIEYVTIKKTLKSTTFLSFKNLPRYVEGYAKRARWCPVCMREFSEKGHTGYFKLLWSLNNVKHCHKHYITLVDKCEACGAYQDGFSLRKSCVLCQNCGEPLGQQYLTSKPINSWEFQCEDLVHLVSEIAKNPELIFPEYGASRFVSWLYNFYEYSDHPFAKCLMAISHSKPNRIMNGKMKISLLNARRLSAAAGVSIVDFLMGSYENIPLDFQTDWKDSVPSRILIQERIRISKKNLVLSDIDLFLRKIHRNFPPSLRAVARHVKVSVGYIEYHFPGLAKAIVLKHRSWKVSQIKNKKLLARSEAELFFKGKKYSALNRSRKSAFKLIREKTGLPKNLLRNEINRVYKKMNE